jgi:gas vesicle structural protein
MTVATQSQSRGSGYLERPAPSSLADVIETILDKGLVIDAYVRVSLVGIELLTIDARIVIASVDTYLRFAEAANRLDLNETGNSQGLPELLEGMTESGAKGKTGGAIEGAKDKFEQMFGSDDSDDDKSGDDDEDSGDDSKAQQRPRRRKRPQPAR